MQLECIHNATDINTPNATDVNPYKNIIIAQFTRYITRAT